MGNKVPKQIAAVNCICCFFLVWAKKIEEQAPLEAGILKAKALIIQ